MVSKSLGNDDPVMANPWFDSAWEVSLSYNDGLLLGKIEVNVIAVAVAIDRGS